MRNITPLAPVDNLPSTLPTVHLTELEMQEDYGITLVNLPRRAKTSLEAFSNWSTSTINLERGKEYAKPVQKTSIDDTLRVIRSYIGWCNTHQGVPLKELDIHLLADAHKFAHFMGYLIARGVCKGTKLKQIAVAKKVGGTVF